MRPSYHFRYISVFPLLLILLAGPALLGSMSVAAYASSATLKLSTKSGMPSSTAYASNCGSWSVVPSPNFGTRPTFFSSVTATSANDAWVVGAYVNSSRVDQTLIEHWDGTSWSIAPGPKTGGSYSALYGVKALSAKNAWAVGYYLPSTSQTLIEHWNGTSWSIVPSPNVSMLNNYLVALTAISASDIWAVGYYVNSSNVDQTLIEHWNGTSWSIASSPNTGSGNNILNAVASSSTGDVWAVGTAHSNVSQTLIEHWNGSSWSIIPSPNAGSLGSVLTGVTTVSVNDAWAVGTSLVSGSPFDYAQTLIEHWNGSTWSIVSSPNVGSNWNILEAVKAVSATNIWAVGYYQDSSDVDQTLIEHWNGTHWKVVSSPNAGTYNNFLLAITRIPGTSQMWTVGSYYPGLYDVAQTLTEFYC